MKLDINEIYHQYIIRVVIFSLFLHKNLIKQPNIYKQTIYSFVNKRIPWKIKLTIDTGIQLDKEDQREIVLEELLNDVESDYLKIITASFTTPMKDVSLIIDLREEEKYQNFLYN